jgi:hypothetical protein
MPKSVYERLDLGDLKNTRMSLQLADKSIRFPEGIVEDVIVQIGKFLLVVDFVVVEMEEDTHTPLLLGRDFLITVGANIDMKKGKFSFQIEDETVDFHVFNAMKFPFNDNDSIYRIEIVDSIVADEMGAILGGENLDQILSETDSETAQKDFAFNLRLINLVKIITALVFGSIPIFTTRIDCALVIQSTLRI